MVLTIQDQLNYLGSADLGYDPQNIMYLESNDFLRDDQTAFIEDLRMVSGVEQVSLGSVPIESRIATDRWSWPGKGPDSEFWVHPMIADASYLEVFQLRLCQGRWYSRESAANSTGTFVINEEAARVMGMADPIGQTIDFSGNPGVVIGVVDDFNYGRLHEAIRPVVFMMDQPGHLLPRR